MRHGDIDLVGHGHAVTGDVGLEGCLHLAR
jgi:hypothetical protein